MQLISMVERILGDEPGAEEFSDAFNKAQQKLHRIIQREGSDGGLRFGNHIEGISLRVFELALVMSISIRYHCPFPRRSPDT